MMKFKYGNLTSIYDKGQYTLTADKGYQLKNRLTGETCKTVKTRNYTQWEAIEGEPLTLEQEAEKNRKAIATLGTIFEMASNMNRISEDDERLEAFDAKMRETFPGYDSEVNCPPIDDVLALLRENGLGVFADAFNKAWADEDFVPMIEALPEVEIDDEPNPDENDGEGDKPAEGEGVETEQPEQPAQEETPAEAPAETPAEEPKKKGKSKKVEK